MTQNTTIELTPWELQKLKTTAATNALTYLGHHANGNLFEHEIAEMNRWKMLSDKLAGDEPTPIKDTTIDGKVIA